MVHYSLLFACTSARQTDGENYIYIYICHCAQKEKNNNIEEASDCVCSSWEERLVVKKKKFLVRTVPYAIIRGSATSHAS